MHDNVYQIVVFYIVSKQNILFVILRFDKGLCGTTLQLTTALKFVFANFNAVVSCKECRSLDTIK